MCLISPGGFIGGWRPLHYLVFLAKDDPKMGVLAAELAANADFKFQLDAIQTLETGSKGPTGSLLKVFSFYGLGGGPWGGVNGYTPVCPGFLGCLC